MNDSLLDELPSLSFEVMKRHAKNICKCYSFDICPSPPHILSACPGGETESTRRAARKFSCRKDRCVVSLQNRQHLAHDHSRAQMAGFSRGYCAVS